MADYIEREKTVELLRSLGDRGYRREKGTIQDAIKMISFPEYTPTADVATVVHSYWEEYSCSQYMGTDECGEPKWRDGRFFVCHNYKCRRKTVIKSNYCPNCGARMDLGDKNNG